MFENNKNGLDDLINGSGQPIIVQESGSDKKFLYTLLILLVVLFLIALGLIAFLGSKFFGNNSAAEQNRVVQQVKEPKGSSETEEAAKKVVAQIAQKHKQAKNGSDELENLVQQQENPKPKTKVEKTIAQVASSSGAKGLSPEDLEKIAKLVAQELAKRNKAPEKPAAAASSADAQPKPAASSSASEDAALLASLQSAEADTLKEQKIDESTIKKSNVQAKTSSEKVDTFNKVIVNKKSSKDDELAKLSSEIDAILQSEDVKKQEQNLQYKQEYEKEAKERAAEMRYYVVKKGDTLSSIAYKAYGNWAAYVKIYKANPDLIKNPNRIYVGMRLRVPVDKEYKANHSGR